MTMHKRLRNLPGDYVCNDMTWTNYQSNGQIKKDGINNGVLQKTKCRGMPLNMYASTTTCKMGYHLCCKYIITLFSKP